MEFTVLSNNDGEPVKSAEIVYSNSDGIASTLVVTDEEGKGGCLLPAGTWHVKIISDRYSTLAEMPIEVKPDIPFASQVRLPPRKPLTISVADETTGGDTPAIAKVTIESVHGENPELSILPGSPFRNNTIVVSHMPQTIYLDPGKYVVTASRGPAFTIDSRAIQTNDRAEQSETFRIRRLFSRDEYLNIDMNLHSAAGFGGPLTASELASICMAEGLDAAVVENDVVRVASTSTPAKTSGFTFIPGIQVWNAGCGVFNLMPVPPELIRPDLNTALPSECNQTIRRIALRPNIVITSPLERRYGYFNLTGLDTTGNLEGIAEAQSEFDAIEFSREKNPGDTDALLHEWFQLLNTGSQVAAVGASESDIRSRREPGCFRTSIPMPSGTGGIATAEAICNRIIKDRMGIVTNGPMIRISANKDGLMGSLINARGGVTKIRVTVEAAPWVSTATLELVINGAVATTAILSDGPELKRFDSIFTIPVDRDSWVVAVVRGKRGMHPVIQGKGEAAVIPMAFTNPVWLDADGDGGFSRPPPKR
ncbi:MAG TPA: hypothetical protein PL033_05385 [Candidatus Brocadiia bacterium]|nr:hypothetical protein [Candidatus Brocadiia bacterium]